jgi:hypothetical protein
MEVIQVAVKLQFRRDTAANWESNNTILSEGELGLDTTNERFKIGNGVDGWNAIDFAQYTNKAETFTATTTLVGSDGSSDWTEETTGDWDGVFTTTKTVTGVLTTDIPIIEIDLSNANATTFENILAGYSTIFRAEIVSNNNLKFYAIEEPAPNLTIIIKVVR